VDHPNRGELHKTSRARLTFQKDRVYQAGFKFQATLLWESSAKWWRPRARLPEWGDKGAQHHRKACSTWIKPTLARSPWKSTSMTSTCCSRRSYHQTPKESSGGTCHGVQVSFRIVQATSKTQWCVTKARSPQKSLASKWWKRVHSTNSNSQIFQSIRQD